MEQTELEKWVTDGKSIADIANLTGKSKTAVRHWLNKYGLTTQGKPGQRTRSIIANNKKECLLCNELLDIDNFRKRVDRDTLSPYCKSCESTKAQTMQRRLKDEYVTYMGGKCQGCDRNFHNACYDFHHLEPEHKDFALSVKKMNSLESVKDELDKCVLVCTICHNKAHRIMKHKSGFNNKIKGNTELWRKNRRRKFEFLKKFSCETCGYDDSTLDLCLIFPKYLSTEERLKWKKYNKTHWSDDYIAILKQARVICTNCRRIEESKY